MSTPSTKKKLLQLIAQSLKNLVALKQDYPALTFQTADTQLMELSKKVFQKFTNPRPETILEGDAKPILVAGGAAKPNYEKQIEQIKTDIKAFERRVLEFENAQKAFSKNDRLAYPTQEKFDKQILTQEKDRTKLQKDAATSVADFDKKLSAMRTTIGKDTKLDDAKKADLYLALDAIVPKTEFEPLLKRIANQQWLDEAKEFRKNLANAGDANSQALYRNTLQAVVNTPKTAENKALLENFERDFLATLKSTPFSMKALTEKEMTIQGLPTPLPAKGGGRLIVQNGKLVVLANNDLPEDVKRTSEEAAKVATLESEIRTLERKEEPTESDLLVLAQKRQSRLNILDNFETRVYMSPEDYLKDMANSNQAMFAHEAQHLIQAQAGRLVLKQDGTSFALFYDIEDEVEAYKVQFSICRAFFPVGENPQKAKNLSEITAAYIANIKPSYRKIANVPAFDKTTSLAIILSDFPNKTEPDYINFVECIKTMAGGLALSEADAIKNLAAKNVTTWKDFHEALKKDAPLKNKLNII